MALYDAIGKNYAYTRRSDPRIAENLLEILSSSQVSTVADIGAGTGSYALVLAEHGYRVLTSARRARSDSFAAVGWARPELYLNSGIRSSISSFSKIEDHELNSGLSRLAEDLERGRWDRKYGHLREQSQYDAGYRFIHRLAI